MKKKILLGIGILVCLVFSFSMCFAANGLGEAANGVRNFVGGVENTVENAAKDVSNASKDATGSVENHTESGMNSITKNSTGTSMGTNSRINNDGNYQTSRTSANGTFMGMNQTAWTWLILGIAAIIIVALVWYYSMQFTNNNNNNNRD